MEDKTKFLLNTYTLKIDCKHNQQKMLHPKNILKLITELKHKIDTLNKSCINCKYILDENYKIHTKELNKIYIVFNIMYELTYRINKIK